MTGDTQQTSAATETAAAPRPAWVAPDLVELSIWTDTGQKGTSSNEAFTTKYATPAS